MKLKVIQTCDATSPYKTLLEVTRLVNEQYCKRHNYAYEVFTGIKHGVHPWHACFNRIFMFEDEINKQEYDWILYMDADCFVHNLDIKAEDIVADGGDVGMLFCGGAGPDCPVMYEVNSGVIFMNVRNRYADAIVKMWKAVFVSIFTDDVCQRSVVPFGLVGGPSNAIIADQGMLTQILHIYYSFGVLDNIAVKTYRGADYTKFNYNGDFIKQLLRPHCGQYGTQIEERIVAAREQVTEVAVRFGLAPSSPPVTAVEKPNKLVCSGFIGM